MENLSEKAKVMAESKFNYIDSDPWSGITNREYMATQILTGLVVPAIPGSHNADNANENKYKAEHAVNLADALLEALSKP